MNDPTSESALPKTASSSPDPFVPGALKPGWRLRLVGLLILLLPGGIGFYGLILWLGGGGETHALNVGQLAFVAIGLPSYLFGGLLYYAGWRVKQPPEAE